MVVCNLYHCDNKTHNNNNVSIYVDKEAGNFIKTSTSNILLSCSDLCIKRETNFNCQALVPESPRPKFRGMGLQKNPAKETYILALYKAKFRRTFRSCLEFVSCLPT